MLTAMRFFITSIIFLFCNVVSAQQLDELKRPKAIAYSADRCRYDARGRRATCSGHVVVHRSDLKISCQHLVAEMDVQGRVTKLSCEHNVEIVTKDRVARSDGARYSAIEDKLELEGNARVAQGENRLAGSSISINLESGDIEVSGRVRGVLGPELMQTR